MKLGASLHLISCIIACSMIVSRSACMEKEASSQTKIEQIQHSRIEVKTNKFQCICKMGVSDSGIFTNILYFLPKDAQTEAYIGGIECSCSKEFSRTPRHMNIVEALFRIACTDIKKNGSSIASLRSGMLNSPHCIAYVLSTLLDKTEMCKPIPCLALPLKPSSNAEIAFFENSLQPLINVEKDLCK